MGFCARPAMQPHGVKRGRAPRVASKKGYAGVCVTTPNKSLTCVGCWALTSPFQGFSGTERNYTEGRDRTAITGCPVETGLLFMVQNQH